MNLRSLSFVTALTGARLCEISTADGAFIFEHHCIDRNLPGGSYGQTSRVGVNKKPRDTEFERIVFDSALHAGGRNHADFLENLTISRRASK